MRSFLMIVISLTITSSASAQIYSQQQIAPAYVGPGVVIQDSLPPVQFAGGTMTSAVAPIATTSYAPLISSTPVYAQPVTSTRPATTYRSTASSSGHVTPGWAQQKAQQAASSSVRGHLNNQLGGARYEGVGWSSVSPRSAVQNCCYWGTRPVSQIGVAKGRDGCWYACVLYQ